MLKGEDCHDFAHINQLPYDLPKESRRKIQVIILVKEKYCFLNINKTFVLAYSI